MNTRKMRWTWAMGMAFLLALAAAGLPDARSLANPPGGDPSGEISKDLKFPNDPGNRGPGLVDPGGGRAGGSRDASNPDDFSVNSPNLRTPDVKVEAVPGNGFTRVLGRLQQLLLRILNPAL